MASTVFYSWQSDVRAAACRTLIRDALEAAVANVAKDTSVGEALRIDSDTSGVPGSPDINKTILAKIEAAQVVVADVTIVQRDPVVGPTPNANVVFELAWSLRALDDKRVITVMNTAFGGPEDLPFDLKFRKAITYKSHPDDSDRATPRKTLQKQLEDALKEALMSRRGSSNEIEVEIGHRPRPGHITAERHLYDLVITLKNIGRRRIEDWEIDVWLPRPYQEPHMTHGAFVLSRSTPEHVFYRFTSRNRREPLRVGDREEFTVGYVVDQKLYRENKDLFASQFVKANASVDGNLVIELSASMTDLQKF